MKITNAEWIRSGKPAECPVFARDFAVDKAVRHAELEITAAGVYEAALNGRRVGDFFLAPGWTVYRTRLQVQTYDVTALLRSRNQLAVTVGSGWYCGTIARLKTPQPVRLIASLTIEYTDGTTDQIITDGSWQTTESATRYADIYNGETCDANFRDDSPVPAVVDDAFPKSQLIPQQGEPVRVMSE